VLRSLVEQFRFPQFFERQFEQVTVECRVFGAGLFPEEIEDMGGGRIQEMDRLGL
jgi:hypothetical protein